jgi:hypothetical protein
MNTKRCYEYKEMLWIQRDVMNTRRCYEYKEML